jgi:hypothetical protein
MIPTARSRRSGGGNGKIMHTDRGGYYSQNYAEYILNLHAYIPLRLTSFLVNWRDEARTNRTEQNETSNQTHRLGKQKNKKL